MGYAAYRRPAVSDHGSLAALTADFDINFVGSVAKTLILAQISSPIVPPGGDVLGDVGGSTGGDLTVLNPDDGGGVLGDQQPSGGTGGGAGGGGGAGAGAGGGGGGALDSGEGGKLPFTGYAALTVAALGAGFTSIGVAMRALLRRAPRP